MRVGVLTVMLVLAASPAVPPVPAAAQAVNVLVDGAPVAFDQPPLIAGGRVLIPLRGVFERLGALVEWEAESRTIIARHGSTVIVLQPGVSSARVNDRPVTLDAPAIIRGGRALVPLRFLSEALGAAVAWDAARRTVVVAPPRAAPPPAPPVVTPQPLPPPEPIRPPPAIPPRPPEPAQPPRLPPIIIPPPTPLPPVPAPPIPARTEGTVIRVEVHQARLLVRSDGVVYRILVGPDTAIFLVEASTGRGGAAALDDIRRGDHAFITVDAEGRALSIRAAYRELAGRLDDLTGRTVSLRDGRSFRLGDAPLFLLDGREVTRDLLRPGMEVVLRLSPQTGEAWEIRAHGGPEPPRPPAVPPRIDGIHVSQARPLGVGDTLSITMYGTPGGAARFTVARLDDEVPMLEGPAGQYTGRRTIRFGESALRATITVRLRISGIETSVVAGTLVTVDGFPPEFTRRAPEPNSVTADARPVIALGFTDRGPAGIDPAGFRLWINGQEIRGAAVSEGAASYEPTSPLPPGRIRVQARIADRAGNEATTVWTFEVARAVFPTPGPTPPSVGPTPPPASRPPQPPGSVPPVVPPPVILEPRPQDGLRSPLIIRGTAGRGQQVEVTVEFRSLPEGSTVLYEPVTDDVDLSGRWSVRIQLPSPLPRSGRVTISAVAVSPSGARSEPARVVITWPRE